MAKKVAKVAKVEAASETPEKKQGQRKRIVGSVVSDKMQKTIVVDVTRRVQDGNYGKYIVLSKRFKAHDEQNEATEGDYVELEETRPLSKDKRWTLKRIIRKTPKALAAEA